MKNHLMLGKLVIERLGLRHGLRYILAERLLDFLPTAKRGANPYRLYNLYVPGIPEPLVCRSQSSDRYAFAQVFVHHQYACQVPKVIPEYIVDCGANVGYASAYFLNRFPAARLVAVEPDPGNYEILIKNLAPYDERVSPLMAAVWSNRAGVMLCKDLDAKGGEWSSHVRSCLVGEDPDVKTVDVEYLLSLSPHGFIDILKIDIEGAEKEIFTNNYQSWIQHVGMIMIEIHNEDCDRAFFQALGSREFQVHRQGEVTQVSLLHHGNT